MKNLDIPVIEISSPAEAFDTFPDALPILPLEAKTFAVKGVSSSRNATAILESIERAARYALDGSVAGIITNPIQKSSLLEAGFGFPGHTEYVADLTKNEPMPAGRLRGPVMMLAGPLLRTVPVTIHLPVKDAIKSLTPQKIINAVVVTNEALRFDYGIEKPRLVILRPEPSRR